MKLENERLLIREFLSSDQTDLHEILGDDETMFYCESAYSPEKAETFLNEFCLGQPAPAFALVLKKTGKVVAYMFFKALEAPDVYEIGWWINRQFWRQGIAYESCKMLIEYGFDQLGLRKIVAETIDDQASKSLMIKLGMKEVQTEPSQMADNAGQLHDLIWYEIEKVG